jgi:hypothetical protein
MASRFHRSKELGEGPGSSEIRGNTPRPHPFGTRRASSFAMLDDPRSRLLHAIVVMGASLTSGGLVSCGATEGGRQDVSVKDAVAEESGEDSTTGHDGSIFADVTSSQDVSDVACRPGSTQCTNDSVGVETCGPDGHWETPVACPAGCYNAGCGMMP